MPGESTTYPALFRIPAFPQLAAAVLIARTAVQMMQLAIVLFVLQHFHSPSLAGLTVFLGTAPGIAMSPIAGALLDRYGRIRLITLDYLVGAATLGAIIALNQAGLLSPLVLLPIVTVGSLTYSLSNSGARSLLPLLVPRQLWDRANALDSIAYAVTIAGGPVLAGGLTAWLGSGAALLITASFYLLAAILMIRLPEPRVAAPTRPVLVDALAALRYVMLSNPTLRGIVIVVGVLNVGFGMVVIALPVMVFQRIHGDAALVGEVWAMYGLASVPSALIAGRFDTRGRERWTMGICSVATALGIGILAVAPNAWVVAAAMLFAGLANGPFDVSMFSMRQRNIDPTWFGRGLAVSMGLNWTGEPIGAALSGPLIHVGLGFTFVTAAALALIGAAIVPLVIPAEGRGRITAESARQSRRDRPVEESPSSAEQGAG